MYVAVAFSHFGKFLAACSVFPEQTDIFEVSSGKWLTRYFGASLDGGFALHPEGEMLANFNIDQGGSSVTFVRIQEDQTNADKDSIIQAFSPCYSAFMELGGISFSPDGKYLALVGGLTTVEVKLLCFPELSQKWEWCANKKATQAQYVYHSGASLFENVIFRPDGTSLFVGTEGGEIIELHTETGSQVSAFSPHQSPISSISAHNSGKWIATGGIDGQIKLWQAPFATAYSKPQGKDITKEFLNRFSCIPPEEKYLIDFYPEN